MEIPLEQHVLENSTVRVTLLIDQHQSKTEQTSSYQGIPTTTANTCPKDIECETKMEDPNSTITAEQYRCKESANPETLPGSDFTFVLQDVTASPAQGQPKHLQDASVKDSSPPEHLPCPDLTSDLQDVARTTALSPSQLIRDASFHESSYLPICFRCGLCQIDFNFYETLKEHLQNEHFQKNVQLQNCDNLIKHVFLLTGTESFKCDLCNIHFPHFDFAEAHLKCHRTQDQACGQSFEDPEHQNVCSNIFTCGVCGKGYPKQSDLVCHRKSHDFKKCLYCPKMFLFDSDLESHMHSHHVSDIGESEEAVSHEFLAGPEVADFQRSKKTFAPEESLPSINYTGPSDGPESTDIESDVADQPGEGSEEVDEEMEEDQEEDFSDLISFDDQTAFGGDQEKLSNTSCNDLEDKGFEEDYQILQCGIEGLAHDQVRMFECERCNESFRSLEDLETHEVSHEDEPLKCNSCDRTFRYSQHLKQHMKIHKKEFACDDCSEIFESLVQLREHNLIHSTSEVYKCELCDKQFAMKKALERHGSLHTGEKPYKCQFCDKCFRLPSSLQHHERIHKGLTPFKCDICNKRFRLSQALKKHIFAYHSKDKPYKCDICEKGFVEKGRLTAHKSRIHFAKPKEKTLYEYICVLCQKGFNSKTSLDEHLTHFHSKKKDGELTTGEKISDELDKVFICVKCGKGFNTCEKLLAHMRRHGEPNWMDKSDSCRSTCPICHKSVNYLQKHLITHTGLKPFQCEICDKAFPERYILTKHMKSHSTVRQFECKLCTSTFKRGDNLKRHLRITHSVDPEKYDTKQITLTKNKEFLCKKCDIVFMDNEEFKQHKKSHSEKIPAVCSMCGKLFTNDIHLKSHMKIHANWRPYMCETCGKTFTENSQLKKHIRIHTGEKPYACQLCDKSFSQSCSLNSHMKSHQFAGQMPFKCNLCPAEFAYCGELEKHKKGHMGTDVFGCGICSMRFSHPDHLKTHVDEHFGKSSQSTESTQVLEVGPVIETAIADVNPFQSDPCLSYPVASVSYSDPVDPVVPYSQLDVGSVPDCVTVAPYPSDPNLNQSISSDTVPQCINMFQMQTLVQEAEMLIQCTQTN